MSYTRNAQDPEPEELTFNDQPEWVRKLLIDRIRYLFADENIVDVQPAKNNEGIIIRSTSEAYKITFLRVELEK